MELLRTSDGHVFCLIARFVLDSALTWRFGYSMFGFSVALLPGAGGLSFAFVTVCDVVLRNLPCSSVGELHCTGPTNVRKIAMEECFILWGRSGLLVRLGGASSVVRAVPIATGCSVKVGLSISVSFWLRMPGHGGAGSRSRNGLFCVPWARCTRAVAPCLLCEELAVILVVGGGCGASAHPCEASASGLFVPWFLAPFYQSCGWRCGTWVDPVLLA